LIHEEEVDVRVKHLTLQIARLIVPIRLLEVIKCVEIPLRADLGGAAGVHPIPVHKNDKSGVVDDEQLHQGPFGVPFGGAGIGRPPVHVLIKSRFVDGSLQLLQRIVDDFEFDDQDLCDAQEGGNNYLECASSSFQMDRGRWP
jgi:hypothetical protein